MPAVRVYQPRKNAMQSGRGKTKFWLVEFEPGARAQNDSLMGWVGQGDTRNQLRMRFDSRDDAVAQRMVWIIRLSNLNPAGFTANPTPIISVTTGTRTGPTRS